jgi:hypothetical protein
MLQQFLHQFLQYHRNYKLPLISINNLHHDYNYYKLCSPNINYCNHDEDYLLKLRVIYSCDDIVETDEEIAAA